MAGFGDAPAGIFPAGLGTVGDPAEKPTGTPGARFINPVTRDYERDETTGQFKQMPSTRQRVMLAVATEFDSSGVRGFGVRMPRKMGITFEADARSAISSALRHMTEVEKSIRLNRVLVERGEFGRARFTIDYTDLVTGERDRATV